jgi:hypothetical protein
MTERHLIEELATIIWRKRRVLLAEGAKINEGLKSTLSSPKSVIPSAAPFQRGLSARTPTCANCWTRPRKDCRTPAGGRRLIWLRPERRRRSCARAARMPTTKARRALIPESRDWWDEHVDEEEHPATAEGLAGFIRESLEPICYRRYGREADIPRRSRRKPWAKGCGRTCWRSLTATKRTWTANSSEHWP